MSRKLHKGKKMSLPPFVAVTWEVLNSKAFVDLSHHARVALLYFLGKPKRHPKDSEYYSTPFTFPYSEAKRLGFPNSTFAKAIRALVAHGFIDPVEKGGCFGDLKKANRFTLSERWRSFGVANFEVIDWRGFVQRPRKTKGHTAR